MVTDLSDLWAKNSWNVTLIQQAVTLATENETIDNGDLKHVIFAPKKTDL